jgi:C1A family cysteine protease
MNTERKYGWKPQVRDERDFKFKTPRHIAENLPPSVDLRSQCSPVQNQENLGSCTANSIGAAHMFDQLKQKNADAFAPSRLFIYYNERVIEGTVDQDSGAEIRDGIKSIAQQGVCPETQWPYDVNKFTQKPSAACYVNALKYQALKYEAVEQTLSEMKGCLASGFPWVFGFTVYSSFEGPDVAKTGIVPMPAPGEEQLGGHAVLCVGYDDATQRFTVQNSWGPGWGLGGFFTIPYNYLTDSNLASDFWKVTIVEDDTTPAPAPVPLPWWKKVLNSIFGGKLGS